MRADVIVVGGGNAGFTAAHAATQRGRRVVVLEKGQPSDAGGNSFYTAGATRLAHDGLRDLLDFVEPDPRHERTEVPAYSQMDFLNDMEKVTDGRNDPELTKVLVGESNIVVRWLCSLGVHYRLMYERQAFELEDGGFRFWGGLHVGAVGGGEGLMKDHTRIALAEGVEIVYGCDVTDLIVEQGAVRGVRAIDSARGVVELRAESVILAAGGFEADPERRETYLGPGWAKAKIRGTPLNTGDVIEAALRAGAARGGDWTTCHSTAWDAWYPENESNRELTNRLTRQSYPFGIIVNAEGRRFVDEGADFRNYTYARYGREILAQPGSIAFQLFDSNTLALLREEEYEMPGISKLTAGTLDELAHAIGADAATLTTTVDDYNDGIATEVPFDPTVKDGRSSSTVPPKSNWAQAFAVAPFYAFPVTCGITFTFGGLKADIDARVLDGEDNPIPGLFVCGEMLGGLFAGNYPGGSGLAAGSVFGRRAGLIA